MSFHLVVLGLQAITSIHNVLMGKIYLEHKGSWVVGNPGGPLAVKLRFIPTGMLATKRSYEVRIVLNLFAGSKAIWTPGQQQNGQLKCCTIRQGTNVRPAPYSQSLAYVEL
jgi:hypothetical protein